MNERKFVLGIDTSNYKTSVAITDLKGNIISDARRFLQVRQGERGLRQSHALFQHIENLPFLVEEAISSISRDEIVAVAVSTRPRPVDGSYMPVFRAGESTARSIAAALDVPIYEFSHQEGHIKAIASGTRFDSEDEFLSYHLSGGTCELLKVKTTESGYEIEILGGTKDISYGQVIDRLGVLLGMSFPAGEEMDKLALESAAETKLLKKIPLDNLEINLSGIDTQCKRCVENAEGNIDKAALSKELFSKIADSLAALTKKAVETTGINKVLFAGGVSSSSYIRAYLGKAFARENIIYEFGDPVLSSDNSVGIAFLGGKVYGNEARKGITTE